MDTAMTAYLMTSDQARDVAAGEVVTPRALLWTWVLVAVCVSLLPFLKLS